MLNVHLSVTVAALSKARHVLDPQTLESLVRTTYGEWMFVCFRVLFRQGKALELD
jgi:hypothetical protein